MIGINYLKSNKIQRGEVKEDSILLKESWHKKEELLYIEGVHYSDRLIASLYDGYPIKKWTDDHAVYVIEGIIYNIPEDIIQVYLSNISWSFSLELVGDFVKKADGDFIVFIYDKQSKKVLIFNDELGGLPFHYRIADNSFAAGRSLTHLSFVSNDYNLSKENIAEQVYFNYNMADRTIFKNILSLEPASYLLCEEKSGYLVVSEGSTVERSYELVNPFRSKFEAIRVLKDLFIEGCKVRCEYAKTNGFVIVNTMSGGFDSRTVLGGIESCIKSEDYQNLTYEYKQDESKVASEVLDAIGSKSKYIKLSYENVPNVYDADLSFKTEGKVSTYTNSVCYNDLVYSYEHYLGDQKLLYFGGFGGEFIRHPLFSTIWNSSNICSKSSPSLKEVCKLFSVDYRKTKTVIQSTFNECDSRESFCKMFYDEYYRRYVRGAGEERTRMFYFTVQPLMSKSFILAIRNRIPLSWVGYEFYLDFLNAINPALTKVGVYGGIPNIFSLSSIKQSDYENKSVFHNIGRMAIVSLHLKKWQKGRMNVKTLCQKLDNVTIVNKEYLRSHFPNYSQHAQCKIAALLYYVNELEDRLCTKK